MKYPKTRHLKGSKGILEDDQVDLADVPGNRLVIEEKMDGTEVSLAWDGDGFDIRSRGEPVDGSREDMAALKGWVWEHFDVFESRLKDRYVLWGEWLWAKHTVYYDSLDDYFLHYDLWDRRAEKFCTTWKRMELFADSGLSSVPIVSYGRPDPYCNNAALDEIFGLMTKRSAARSEDWREHLAIAARLAEVDPVEALAHTFDADHAEGLYLKTETSDEVVGFYKWIRPGFLDTLLESGSHWRDRPIIRNRLENECF